MDPSSIAPVVALAPLDPSKEQGLRSIALRLHDDPPHPVRQFARIPRCWGGAPETEIVFRLPSIRIEQIRAGRYSVGSLTAITPIDARRTEINHCVYWTAPWLTALKPFCGSRARLLRPGPCDHGAPAAGLTLRPTVDLDRRRRHPSKMVLRLGANIAGLCAEGRPFENPIEPRTPRMAQLKVAGGQYVVSSLR